MTTRHFIEIAPSDRESEIYLAVADHKRFTVRRTDCGPGQWVAQAIDDDSAPPIFAWRMSDIEAEIALVAFH